MTKHNLQTNDFACLVKGLSHEASSEIDFETFHPNSESHQQAKPILVAIVKEIEAAEKVDEMISGIATNWATPNAGKQTAFIKKEFGANGEQLLTIFGQKHEQVHYLILSALLNSKKQKEDIRLYTCEQIASHITSPIPKVSTHNKGAQAETFLILKFILEQNLLQLALNKKRSETDADPQQVEVVTKLLQAMRFRSEAAGWKGVDLTRLLKSFQDFSAPNMFVMFSKAEESYPYRWIIGGIVTALSLLIVIILSTFNFK